MLSKAMSEQLNSKIFWGSMPPDPESAAMVTVNITANASELGVSAIIVATSIVEELTAAAIDQPEVCHQFTSS